MARTRLHDVSTQKLTAEFLARALNLNGEAKQSSSGYWNCTCPAKNHKTGGLKCGFKDLPNGGVHPNCFAGCTKADIWDAVIEQGIITREQLQENTRQSQKLTVAQLAATKDLPAEFLRELGLTDSKGMVRIPYFNKQGDEAVVRYRIALSGVDRFRWQKSPKVCLYGLNHMRRAVKDITIVEGESDCWTLWLHEFNAVGLPGATMWNEERDAPHFAPYEKIYVVIEPGDSGAKMLEWLNKSSIRDRAYLIFMRESYKDPSEVYQQLQDQFEVCWREGFQQEDAKKWADYAELERQKQREAARQRAATLLANPNILDAVEKQCHALGVVGEARLIRLIYLIATTRIFARVCSIIVKGPSASGKSLIVELVLSLFPLDAYIAYTSMSEKALIFLDEPMAHRMLVLYEAEGLNRGQLAYYIRSLLSEGHIRYGITEKNAKGEYHTRIIEKEGPTGLIVTTTEISIHPENETRCLSMTADDFPKQNEAVIDALMQRRAQLAKDPPDLSAWHALQQFVALSPHEVVIPFAPVLGNLIEGVGVRLRRDVSTLLALIDAHALLHQETRERDGHGAVIATLQDYELVRDLVHETISEGVDKKVAQTVQDTVYAVSEIITGKGGNECSLAELAKKLKLDKSAASRRAKTAIERGYLQNLETRPRQPAKYARVDGVIMPSEKSVLPTVQTLTEAIEYLRDNKENS